MARDTLFVLAPGFEDNGRREFCPECAEICGVLAYFPAIRDTLDIVHIELEHPREPITALLGEGRFNAPTLVLAAKSDRPAGVPFETANGHDFLSSARMIAMLWAARYGTPSPRGS